MGIQISMHFASDDGQDHPELREQVSNVVAAGVMLGLGQVFQNAATFDPNTGELLYHTPYADMEAMKLLSHIQVASPHAVLNILASTVDEDEVGVMAPSIIEPLWEDD